MRVLNGCLQGVQVTVNMVLEKGSPVLVIGQTTLSCARSTFVVMLPSWIWQYQSHDLWEKTRTLLGQFE